MNYYSKNEAFYRRHTGNMNQIAGIRKVVIDDGKSRGVRVFEFNNGSGLEFDILEDRAMDIGQVRFKGMPLAFISPAGFAHPAYYEPEGINWLRSWGGGMLTTCGLVNVGGPGEYEGQNHGLHGRISHIPAEKTSVSTEWQDGKYVISLSGETRQGRDGYGISLYRS